MMLLHGFRGRTVLLLQGPVGPYFRRLSRELTRQGARVLKLNFNGGDCLFFPEGKAFRGGMEQVRDHVAQLIAREAIDVLMLLGDCRPVHAGMAELADAHGIDLMVFEEGYLRPDFITCERWGVNGHSTIPRDVAYYRQVVPIDESAVQAVGNAYWHMAAWTLLYYVACLLA